ncbi:MAG: UDP-N-acetylmuramate dehydrogenase [Casimicrobiaceae bacterium]
MMMREPERWSGMRGVLARNAPLARHTSWRAGGAADAAYVPADSDDLAAFVAQLSASEPLTVLGLGSNVLVRDGGIRGTVVLLHAALASLEMRDGLLYAQAGVASPKVARFAAAEGLCDAEFLAGIPGTIGGALAMNAGCYGGETWRFVIEVDVLTRDGYLLTRRADAYETGYRTVARRDRAAGNEIFVAARFRFPAGESGAARARIKELLARRSASQPLNLPNAGSVFRNPQGDHAARLIEACALKGYAIGGARVSEKHANFIVNLSGEATAADIESLIVHVRTAVRARTGINLEPEVRIIGEMA